MKKTVVFIVIFLEIINLKAQVGDISASKLMTICTETVPVNSIEFEPSFAFCRLQTEWNNSGNRTTDKNQKLIENSLAGGLVISHCISEKFSLDADIQYQRHLFEQVGNHQQDVFINTDFGKP